jgi:DNA-binding beta-propeller fold protein YncE
MRIVGSLAKNMFRSAVALAAAALVGCGSSPNENGTNAGPDIDLVNRAYIVSRDSGDVTVIDLRTLDIIGSLDVKGTLDHMAELNADFTKGYVDSPGTNESVVFDTATLKEIKRIPLGGEPTHLSLSRDGKTLGIVNEYSNAVSFVDTLKDEEIVRLSGGAFHLPHFVRWAPDGRYAYVANNQSYYITRIDISTFTVDGYITLDGYQPPPNETVLPMEAGFADVQIDKNGIFYAAHATANKVLVYDTVAQQKIGEFPVGASPWIVYAEHPFENIPQHVVPNFGDQTVSLIKSAAPAVDGSITGADQQSYGVNYSPLVPNLAYVMNRIRSEIAVVDVSTAQLVKSIPVGGNTETASTTADGKLIVAAVSSANRVVVIDAMTGNIVKAFDNVGKYPWSVTIPRGQNYCH